MPANAVAKTTVTADGTQQSLTGLTAVRDRSTCVAIPMSGTTIVGPCSNNFFVDFV